MPRAAYKTCRECGRHESECGELSWSRLCGDCGSERLAENMLGISEHRGPAFARWRRAMAASVGAVLLDDTRESA